MPVSIGQPNCSFRCLLFLVAEQSGFRTRQEVTYKGLALFTLFKGPRIVADPFAIHLSCSCQIFDEAVHSHRDIVSCLQTSPVGAYRSLILFH